jgi:hypothetical protein
MTVCVTGMHRSGTSMVMSLLHGLGLHVGSQADLMPATASNPDGHWENVHLVDLADALLGALGGGWDCPPAGVDRSMVAGLGALRHRAIRLKEEVGTRQPWGWKDPRASLLLPFWFDVFPDLRVVVCLRNPLDVARSLHQRGHSSYALGLALWQTYNEQILAATRPEQRLVTHFAAFFERPARELDRLCSFAGLEPGPDTLGEASTRIIAGHRHYASLLAELPPAGVSPAVVDLYRALCDEAGWQEERTEPEAPPAQVPRPLDVTLLQLAGARRRITALAGVIADSERAAAEAAHDLAEQRSVEGAAAAERLAGQIRDLAPLMEDHRQRLDRVEGQVAALRGAIDRLAQIADAQVREGEYQRNVRTIAHIVERVVPPHSTIAVVSKGDVDLLAFSGRRGVHFPRDSDGRHAPQHPGDSAVALALLDDAIGQGAEYLLFPYTARWWLDHYTELAAQLRSVHTLVWEDEMCVIFAISPDRGPEALDARRRSRVAEERSLP